MDNKKSGIPRQTLPPVIDWILKNATSDQLDFLNSMKSHPQFKDFEKLVDAFKLYCMEEVFKTPVKSSEALSAFRAMKVGEFSAFVAILTAIKMTDQEIQRRKNIKY